MARAIFGTLAARWHTLATTPAINKAARVPSTTTCPSWLILHAEARRRGGLELVTGPRAMGGITMGSLSAEPFVDGVGKLGPPEYASNL
jgi:hypothetical protein